MRCPICDLEYGPGVVFCPADGARLKRGKRSPRRPRGAVAPGGPGGRGRWGWLPVALASTTAVAAVGLGALAYSYLRVPPPPPVVERVAIPAAAEPPAGATVPPGTRAEAFGRPQAPAPDPGPAYEPVREEVVSAEAAPSGYAPFEAPVRARATTGDGSRLVLRSAPSSQYGRRLARIPAGAAVDVYGCLDGLDRNDGRTARWCRTSYRGELGWAFAAFLVADSY